MFGIIQCILVEGILCKSIMEFFGCIENNCVVNFEGILDMIGKFVDVEIIDVYLNFLCGKVVCIEDEMGLCVVEILELVIVCICKENDFGVGYYQL